MNIVEYFQKVYMIELKDVNQPLLLVETKIGETYIPPELCVVSGIPEEINNFAKQRVLDKTRKTPEEKMKSICDFAEKLGS